MFKKTFHIQAGFTITHGDLEVKKKNRVRWRGKTMVYLGIMERVIQRNVRELILAS